MLEKKDGRIIKSQETKKKIYEVARQLAEERSFEEVTVEAIVKKAGIAKGSFYVHFKSKDELIINWKL